MDCSLINTGSWSHSKHHQIAHLNTEYYKCPFEFHYAYINIKSRGVIYIYMKNNADHRQLVFPNLFQNHNRLNQHRKSSDQVST